MKNNSVVKVFLGLCVFALLLGPSQAMATNGMRLIGVGPIQRSMGGASIGLPLDSATIVFNPAGISQLKKRVDFGVTLFFPDVSYNATSSTGQVTTNGKTINSDSTSFLIPAFGLVIPTTDKITLGLGTYGVTGMGINYESNLYNNITFTEYAVMELSPVLAYKISDQLALGVAPSIGYAKFEYEAGTTAEVAHQGGSAFGLGYLLGLFYNFSEETTFGLFYESPLWFQDFKYNTIRGKDKLQSNQPQSVGIGVGQHLTNRFRLAFDVLWIDWSNQIGENKPAYTQNSSGATPFNMNWDDQFVFKMGGEFDVTGKVKLRGGYNYGANPLNAFQPFEAVAFPAIAEHHITCGVGIALGKDVDFNFGFMYAPEAGMDASNAAQFINNARTEMT